MEIQSVCGSFLYIRGAMFRPACGLYLDSAISGYNVVFFSVRTRGGAGSSTCSTPTSMYVPHVTTSERHRYLSPSLKLELFNGGPVGCMCDNAMEYYLQEDSYCCTDKKESISLGNKYY